MRFWSFARVFLIIAGWALGGGNAVAQQSPGAETRLALIIANGNYGGDIGSLTNPVNDGKLIAAAMEKVGFAVTLVTDVDQKDMKRAIGDFGEALATAGPNTVALFYYAGHGLQVGGTNYLVPVGASLKREADADLEAVEADSVLKQMEFAGSRINIVILDACRNNPLARSVRSASRGLARMDAPTGSFLAYSTAPGDVAADGSGANSPFATALATEITSPNEPIEEVFRRVRVAVKTETGDRQIPWDSSSLTDAFIFNPTAQAVPAVAAAPDQNVETTLWQSVQNSKDPEELQLFIKQYPNGPYSALAELKLRQLSEADNTNVASRTSGGQAAAKYGYADAALVKLPRELRPPTAVVEAWRSMSPFQAVPEPGKLRVELASTYKDGSQQQTETYESQQLVDGLATVSRKIGTVGVWNGVAGSYRSDVVEQSIMIGPMVFALTGTGHEKAPGNDSDVYYEGRMTSVVSAQGALFPIGPGTHVEIAYSWETQSKQPMSMKMSAQVVGSVTCTDINPALSGDCYQIEARSSYDGGDDERFWNLVYSESEAAFIPWGDFGLNDVVLGTTAVTSIAH